MADASAPTTVPGTTGTAGNQSGTGTGQPANPHPEAKPGETKAQTVARIKADLGDGEQEYDQNHVLELARRGRRTAQTMSKAEQRYQEAQRTQEATEARLARLKSSDMKERRAALKELGLNERELAIAIAEEETTLANMDPKDREILKYQQREAEREAADKKVKEEEGKKAEAAEVERHKEEFAALFLDVVQRAGLPRESAAAAGHRLAIMYQAAGGDLDPDVAAERLKDALSKEHTALYRKKDGTLDLDAFEASMTPDDWKAINRRAVEKYRAARGAGSATRSPSPPSEEPSNTHPPSEKRLVGNAYFKNLDRKFH